MLILSRYHLGRRGLRNWRIAYYSFFRTNLGHNQSWLTASKLTFHIWHSKPHQTTAPPLRIQLLTRLRPTHGESATRTLGFSVFLPLILMIKPRLQAYFPSSLSLLHRSFYSWPITHFSNIIFKFKGRFHYIIIYWDPSSAVLGMEKELKK